MWFRIQARDKRALRVVGYKRRLAVKHGHLGRLQHVASLVALCGLHKKEHFDVAENREAHVGGCVGVESAEDGGGTSDRAMIKWDVEIADGKPAIGNLRPAQYYGYVSGCEPRVSGQTFAKLFQLFRSEPLLRKPVEHLQSDRPDVVLDVEIKIDPDPLEESVGDR